MLARCSWIGIVLAVALALPSPLAAGDQLRIATFNCEFLERTRIYMKYGLPFDDEDWTDEQRTIWSNAEYREARFQESVQAAAKVIHRTAADVIVLCEVGPEADTKVLRDAVAALGLDYPHMAVCKSADTFTRQHVAVFSKRPFAEVHANIPGRESYEPEFDDAETEDETSISKGMQVVISFNERPLHLFAAHLISERGGHDRDMQRVAQASIIRRNYLPLVRAGKYVVVAGDLNDHRGHPTIRRVRGLDDIDEDLIQTGDAKYFDRNQEDTRWTNQYLGERFQIDHVLLSQSIRDATRDGGRIRSATLAVTETIGDSGILASDHRVLVVNIEAP